ncbi:DUF1553 domain-containing protein [Roseimaritima sediminicola]|uniref:DUF1553 domain-containing protein n=1 Tax=Roseimaritima sediminicola TaxID=2662066 RepID=UPI001F41EB86|nr:DUF1553 domain-containing protein [Roseimaritima sediminicola]
MKFARSLAGLLMLASSVATATEPLRFNRDIRPILSDKCFACHGPDAQHAAADLRLDQREAALESGAILPGDAEASELVARIFAEDDDLRMPPPDVHKPLTATERQRLRQWVQQGAEYEAHWAYAPLRPAPENLSPNLVDHFVSKRLQQEQVAAVPAADPATLIRRLSLDLTGMPPTVAEVEAFVADPSPLAYSQLVDRLLESPRYGERMASYWLDLVRYADTVGYHGDQEISQWPYRDYVIRAFNDNLPYDRFIREQLAGDLLPDPTTDQLVASGYNRLNQTTEEGGSQAKEYLAIYFADRVRNVSQVFLGSTLGCAQCHDHKYDPFTAKDFYAFGAFFADLEERGVYSGRGHRPPVMPVPTAEQQRQIDQHQAELQRLHSERQTLRERLLADLSSWQPPPTSEAVWIDDVQPEGRTYSGAWNFVEAADGPVQHGQRSRQQASGDLVQHYFIDADAPVTVSRQTKFYVWVYLDPDDPPQAIMLQLHGGDGKEPSWEHRAVWGGDQIEYGRRKDSWTGYRRMGDLPDTGQWIRLEVDAADVGLATDDDPAAGGGKTFVADGMAFTQFGGRVWWDRAGWHAPPPRIVTDALAVDADQWSAEQRQAVEDYYLATAAPLAEINQQIDQRQRRLEQTKASVATTVISKAVKPRTIRILPRGNWMDDSGDIVQPAVPEFLGQLDVAGRRATRLDLAEWLADPEHPLVARTMVNRLWSLLFGRGICTSVDDFGGQGTYPSHPDLLDALAVEFIESGWDIKHLLRLIVHSDAYRRSSTPTPELIEADPYNDLFARQGRFRLDAEFIRDTALATGGLLVEQVGGPSVRPYQPAGYYAQLNFPRRTYQADTGPKQYRRGLYTHWQRTFLHPMLKAFDAPSREECTALRPRSNTPLQALTLLNDPTFVEAARGFAVRILREGGEDRDRRLRWAYQSVLAQEPSDEIVAVLAEVYAQQRDVYEQSPEAAEQLLATGQSPTPSDLEAAEVAAWTAVARVLLNLHETITRY